MLDRAILVEALGLRSIAELAADFARHEGGCGGPRETPSR
jgi:hypothetical protein